MSKMTPKLQDAIDELEKAKNHTVTFTGEERPFAVRQPFVQLRDAKAVTYKINKETGIRTVTLVKGYEAIIKKEFPVVASDSKEKKIAGDLKKARSKEERIKADIEKTKKVKATVATKGIPKPATEHDVTGYIPKPSKKKAAQKMEAVGNQEIIGRVSNPISAIGPRNFGFVVPHTSIQMSNLVH